MTLVSLGKKKVFDSFVNRLLILSNKISVASESLIRCTVFGCRMKLMNPTLKIRNNSLQDFFPSEITSVP